MKPIILTALIISAAATQANADGLPSTQPGWFLKPYVGADYQYTHLDYKDSGGDVLPESLNGGDVHVGARVNKYLGFEAGYTLNSSASKDNILGTGINSKVKLDGGTLDALGYLPVTSDGKVELIGTVGVTRLEGKVDLSGTAAGNASEWETKGRIGGGAEYWLTDNLNLRGLVRYQGASFSDIGNKVGLAGTGANNAVIANLGVNYEF